MAIHTAKGPVAASGEGARQEQRSSRRLRFPGALALFLVVSAFVLVACGGSDSGDKEEDRMPSVSSGTAAKGSTTDDSAPNFSFTLFQGESELGAKELDLGQLRGKPVVLNFWAGLCPPCRAEMPDLQAFYEDYRDRITLLGIDLGQFTGLGNQQDAVELLEDLGVSYPAGFTPDPSIVPEYSILGMPTTVFIDAEGRIFKSWTGALNQEVLEEQINALLSQ